MAELTRLRKQFIKMETGMLTTHIKTVEGIADSFVIYLKANLS